MNSRVALLTIGAAALAACDLEFVGPESPARYFVTVRFTDSTFTSTTIDAFLDPGYDADGNQRSTPNDSISVWNHTLSPLETNDDGIRRYATTITTDPRALASPLISTQPPPVTGTTATPAELGVDLIWRLSEHTLDLTRTDRSLPLFVANADRLAGVAEGSNWSLTLRARDPESDLRTIYRVASLGLPPQGISVPASVLSSGEYSVLEAQLQTVYRLRFGDESDYIAELTISADLYWTINLPQTQ